MSNLKDRKELEQHVMNKLLYFISKDIGSEHLDNAKREFDFQLIDNKYSVEETEFNSWLIWEYKINNNSIIELFLSSNEDIDDSEREILSALDKSYMSIYDYDSASDTYRDVFTSDKQKIHNIEYDTNNKLIMGRVYQINGESYMFDDCFIIDAKYLNGIEKSFYNNFEEYKRKDPNITKLDFLKAGYLFLISIINIIFNVGHEENDNERLYVYQSDYAILDFDKSIDKLMNQDVIEFEDKMDDQEIYILYRDNSKDQVVGELVLSKKKLEIECINESDRQLAKSFVERLLDKLIVHMGDQLVTMEDL